MTTPSFCALALSRLLGTAVGSLAAVPLTAQVPAATDTVLTLESTRIRFQALRANAKNACQFGAFLNESPPRMRIAKGQVGQVLVDKGLRSYWPT